MTIFDLLVIVAFLAAVASLVGAAVLAIGGQRGRALTTLWKLVLCTAVYIGIVYGTTALSTPVVLHVGEPECSDDWCIAVDGVKQTSRDAVTSYEVTLRIFSRAGRSSQREMGAKDVYLVDADWRRYDPVPDPSNVPLNVLLAAGASVTTRRVFELPSGARGVGLLIDRGNGPVNSICLVIGECTAFHKGTIIRIE